MSKILEINDNIDTAYTIICIHGLGANYNDLVPLYQELNLINKEKIKFLFPEAPIRKISVDDSITNAWYNILSTDITKYDDIHGITSSTNMIIDLILRENKKGIQNSKIILLGFSQGAVISLSTLINYKSNIPLAGVVLLSGYMPSFLKHYMTSNKNTKVIMMHGKYDNIIPINYAIKSYENMSLYFSNIIWKEYDMNHTICNKEIYDLSYFINNIFN